MFCVIALDNTKFQLLHATQPNAFSFLSCSFFWAGCIYGCRNDGERFGFFCHAALEFLLQSGSHPVCFWFKLSFNYQSSPYFWTSLGRTDCKTRQLIWPHVTFRQSFLMSIVAFNMCMPLLWLHLQTHLIKYKKQCIEERNMKQTFFCIRVYFISSRLWEYLPYR